MVDSVFKTGKATGLENLYFGIERGPNYPAINVMSQVKDIPPPIIETYFSFVLVPIFDENGEVIGILNEFAETTHNVIAQRRVATLLDLQTRIVAENTLGEASKAIINSLEPNIQDVPFALLYSINTPNSNAPVTPDITIPRRCVLEGAVGNPVDHMIPDLSSTAACLTPSIEEAWRTGKPVKTSHFDLVRGIAQSKSDLRHVSNPQRRRSSSDLSKAFQHTPTTAGGIDRSISEPPFGHTLQGGDDTNHDHRLLVPGRRFDTAVQAALVLPIPLLGNPDPTGIIVIGMNPQRPYDKEYQDFISSLMKRAVRAVALIGLPEQKRQQQMTAQLMGVQHARISAQLMQRTQNAKRTEAQFRRLANDAPVGMCLFGANGHAIWVNQAYLDHLTLTKEQLNPDTWKQSLHPDDHQTVDDNFKGLQDGIGVSRVELRVRKPGMENEYYWILCDAWAQLDEFEKLETISCWSVIPQRRLFHLLLTLQKEYGYFTPETSRGTTGGKTQGRIRNQKTE
jgi:PAS domain S-box-containing protein